MRCNDNSMFGMSRSAKKLYEFQTRQRKAHHHQSEWRGMKAESQIQKRHCTGMFNIYTKNSLLRCLIFLDNMQHQFHSNFTQCTLNANHLSFKVVDSLPQNYQYVTHFPNSIFSIRSFIHHLQVKMIILKIIFIMSMLFSKTLNCFYTTESKLSQTTTAFSNLTPTNPSICKLSCSRIQVCSRHFVYLLFPFTCFSFSYFQIFLSVQSACVFS